VKEQSVLLELKSIRKEYPGVIALDNLSLCFREGEVHAICGENGAGKSTLIKTITGAIQPTEGEIIYCGNRVEHQNPIASMEAGIACIYQEFNLIPELSIAENIFFGREIMKSGLVDYQSMYSRTEKILEELGVCIEPKVLVKDLTVGFQQIVEIAKALSQDVRVLIMDEPSAPLTNNELEYLFAIVRKLKKQNVTIIYISHRLEEVFELADRVSIIRDGKYISTMEIQDTTRNQLIHLMVGRELGSDFPEKQKSIGEPILEVMDLNTEILKNITFKVKKGEILGLAGLVGAGRSETARAIFGADPIQSGILKLNGNEITVKSPGHAISQGIGLIPEDRKQHGILSMLSIRENISFSCLSDFVKGFFINSKKERNEAEKMKQMLQIKTPSLEVPVSSLSGGNQQKVVLSKSLMANSDILFFDEPTRGIDVGAKQEIYKLMNDLASQGKAIVMISSEMPELIGMSDRILVLCEGEIVKELQPEEFTQEIILEYASGGKIDGYCDEIQ
jgi:ribose transport system ATP-binding protein